jgi:hypothetical protein
MLLPTAAAAAPEQANAICEDQKALISSSQVDYGLPMICLPPEEGQLLYNLTSNLTQTEAVEMSKYVVNVAYMPR